MRLPKATNVVQLAMCALGVAVVWQLYSVRVSLARMTVELQATQNQPSDLRRRASGVSGSRETPAAENVPPAVSIAQANSKGNREARVALIEYQDFQCPYCAAAFRDLLPVVERDYIAPGRVLLVFKHLPLRSIHPAALPAAQAAECAGAQGRFWPMHDRLFQVSPALDRKTLLERAH